FTLIELLISIAVIGILAAVVVVVLNPAQLLAESRDSRRIQDLGNLNNAIGMYLTEGNTSLGQSNVVYVSLALLLPDKLTQFITPKRKRLVQSPVAHRLSDAADGQDVRPLS
ncbi:MAG: prepilin-type N-terminal cleavage/methylation domain-containing protein, partial [Patescibacteria group bacterium]|nr:prepilin-type N-terminal cleavage/methylation domain-containing protein [Patescibacteria group bacterium]